MLTSRLEHSWCPRRFRRWLANKSRSLPSLNKKIGCHLVLKSKAEVIAEVNFKAKAELGKENKTRPPGDISETLPYLCMGWLLYTSSLCDWLWEWRVFNFPIFLVAACKLTCQNNWLNVWIESKKFQLGHILRLTWCFLSTVTPCLIHDVLISEFKINWPAILTDSCDAVKLQLIIIFSVT